MIDDLIATFQYTSPAMVGCLVLIGLLGVVTIGGFAWMLLKDILGGLAALFTLEGVAFMVILTAIMSIIYYAVYG